MEGTAKKRPHNALTLSAKMKVLEDVDRAQESKTAIAKRHGIPKCTLSRILKDREKIQKAYNSGAFTPGRKRMRLADHEDLEKALFLWFKRARSSNLPVTGPILEEKARDIALQIGIEDFKFSDGWLSRFKKRHGLVFRTIAGESAAVDLNVCADWQQQKLQDVLSTYKPSDIFNVDEMALFYKLLPNKTLSLKGEKCTGGKHSKDRVTVLVGANMDGSEKLKLLVIGKAKRPRAFKGVKGLPVFYEANTKAWMTQAIFETWLRERDAEFIKKGRKVVFIVDNCPAHGEVRDLNSIRLEFLPANVTAVLQPMDQGVIRNLKVFYRRHILRRMMLYMESNKGYTVGLLSAIHILAQSWDEVASTTIRRCFGHAGFLEQVDASQEGSDASQEESDADNAEADTVFDLVAQRCGSGTGTMDECEAVDDDVVTCREDTLVDILKEVEEGTGDESEEEMDSDDHQSAPLTSEASQAVELLQRYFQKEGCLEHLCNLNKMNAYLVKQSHTKLKQATLHSFFGGCDP